jgi:alpha-galactosidase
MGYIASTRPGDCWINEGLLKVVSDGLKANGIVDWGYDYFIVGDCWSSMTRSVDGTLQANVTTFADGMQSLSNYVQSNNQKFGVTLGAGSKTCQGYPGSLYHEIMDAGQLYNLGAEYLRYESCYGEGISAQERFTKM